MRFENALLFVVDQPEHACLFDCGPDQGNRFEQGHAATIVARWRETTYISPGNRSGQNAAHRSSTDLKSSRDLGFGDAGAMQFADLRELSGAVRSSGRATQSRS